MKNKDEIRLYLRLIRYSVYMITRLMDEEDEDTKDFNQRMADALAVTGIKNHESYERFMELWRRKP